ncbi:unnamed protein product, partial [Phaeothamnion confervicola]
VLAAAALAAEDVLKDGTLVPVAAHVDDFQFAVPVHDAGQYIAVRPSSRPRAPPPPLVLPPRPSSAPPSSAFSTLPGIEADADGVDIEVEGILQPDRLSRIGSAASNVSAAGAEDSPVRVGSTGAAGGGIVAVGGRGGRAARAGGASSSRLGNRDGASSSRPGNWDGAAEESDALDAPLVTNDVLRQALHGRR